MSDEITLPTRAEEQPLPGRETSFPQAATLLGFAPGTFLYVYSGELASLVSDSGGAEASYPWYVYALGLAGGALLAGKVTDIATATLEAESGIGKE